jgi:membrane peptidoglycan carboxypeptidase
VGQEEEQLLVGKTKATPSTPPRHAGAPYRAPYFVSEVLFQLRDICGPDVLAKGGGLHIYTTLDLALQVCWISGE